MIIDRTPLAGLDAFLKDGGALNLAVSPHRRGSSIPLAEGMAVEVSGIRLYLEADDILKLYPHPDPQRNPADPPLLNVRIRKEVFPRLFADPYASRVHTIAGFEDFQRGVRLNLRPMEVEGKPTLVSTGNGEFLWRSAPYAFPAPLALDAAAWDLATTRLTPPDAFDYELALSYWVTGQNLTSNPAQVTLTPAGGGNPADERRVEGLALRDIIAYRLEMRGKVHFEADVAELDYRGGEALSLGRPLLRAVHLLEPVESQFTVRSMAELEARSSAFTLLNRVEPVRAVSALLAINATLLNGEEISLEVAPGIFRRVEARLEAERRLRPPLTDKALES